jgi:ABC-type Na+ efflux pump permease subunit
MNVYPVFARELRSEVRSHALSRERVRAGLASGLGLAALLLADQWSGGVSVARMMTFLPIAEIGPIMLFIVGLSSGSNLLAAERREGILPLLLLTRLTGHDIVLGKLLRAIVLHAQTALAIMPALVVPLIAAGIGWSELWLAVLGCLNVLLFALACGLLSAVFFDGHKGTSFFVPLLLPWLFFSTPLGRLVPAGLVRDSFEALQPFNPCAALAHVQMAAIGLRPDAYWSKLLTSHALAWGLLILAGFLLPRVCCWQTCVNADRSASKWKWRTALDVQRANAWRRRSLDRNPFHWLTSREAWPTAMVWLWLAISAALWIWFGWLGRRSGVFIVYVLGLIGTGVWFVTLLCLVPSEASRRLVEDRQSGVLEMILCTPLSVREIIRSQWLSLRRRFLPPLLTVMALTTSYIIVGEATSGFGGMVDPEDRGLWLFVCSSAILLLPVALVAGSWVATRRALFARNNGEAGGFAVVQILVLPGLALAGISGLAHWAGLHSDAWTTAIAVSVCFAVTSIASACHARGVLYAHLREAATTRYFASVRPRENPPLQLVNTTATQP